MRSKLVTLSIVIAVSSLLCLPASAAGPVVKKSVLAGDDGSAVILLRVSAGSTSIYGVTVEDATGSIEDVIAPKGWVSISDGSKVLFRTGSKPIKGGATTSFRIVTKNKDAGLRVRFKDAKTQVGPEKTL